MQIANWSEFRKLGILRLYVMSIVFLWDICFFQLRGMPNNWLNGVSKRIAHDKDSTLNNI